MLNFDFISGDKFRELLVRDYEELLKCFEVKANKSVLILVGSIVEAMLVDYYVHNVPDGMKEIDILKLELFKLIELADQDKLINKRTKELASVVRDYRNVIHSGREVRENVEFGDDTSELAMSTLRIIHDDISKKVISKISVNALQISKRILYNPISSDIFLNLITRLNFTESLKLYNLLRETYLNHDNDYKFCRIALKYFYLLKNKHREKIIHEEIKLMVNSFINKDGDSERWLLLLKDDLNQLNKLDKEFIINDIIVSLDDYCFGTKYNGDLFIRDYLDSVGGFFVEDLYKTMLTDKIKNIITITSLLGNESQVASVLITLLKGLDLGFMLEIENNIIFNSEYGATEFMDKYKEYKELPF